MNFSNMTTENDELFSSVNCDDLKRDDVGRSDDKDGWKTPEEQVPSVASTLIETAKTVAAETGFDAGILAPRDVVRVVPSTTSDDHVVGAVSFGVVPDSISIEEPIVVSPSTEVSSAVGLDDHIVGTLLSAGNVLPDVACSSIHTESNGTTKHQCESQILFADSSMMMDEGICLNDKLANCNVDLGSGNEMDPIFNADVCNDVISDFQVNVKMNNESMVDDGFVCLMDDGISDPRNAKLAVATSPSNTGRVLELGVRGSGDGPRKRTAIQGGKSNVVLLQMRPLVPYRTGDSSDSGSEDSESDSTSDVSSSSVSRFSSSSSSSESSDESSTDEVSAIETVADKTVKPYAMKKPIAREIRTKGELSIDDLPPIENLQISAERTELRQIGTVHAIVDKLVIVHSIRGLPVLDLETYLFSEDGATMGQIFEVLGPVVEPYYSIRFNGSAEIEERRVAVGMAVFFTPERKELTAFVFVDQLRQERGSDASWENNNEPPDKYIEYSDDDQESKARTKLRAKRSGAILNGENGNNDGEPKLHGGDTRECKRPHIPNKEFSRNRPILHPSVRFSHPRPRHPNSPFSNPNGPAGSPRHTFPGFTTNGPNFAFRHLAAPRMAPSLPNWMRNGGGFRGLGPPNSGFFGPSPPPIGGEIIGPRLQNNGFIGPRLPSNIFYPVENHGTSNGHQIPTPPALDGNGNSNMEPAKNADFGGMNPISSLSNVRPRAWVPPNQYNPSWNSGLAVRTRFEQPWDGFLTTNPFPAFQPFRPQVQQNFPFQQFLLRPPPPPPASSPPPSSSASLSVDN